MIKNNKNKVLFLLKLLVPSQNNPIDIDNAVYMFKVVVHSLYKVCCYSVNHPLQYLLDSIKTKRRGCNVKA